MELGKFSREFIPKYKSFVVDNPDTVGKIETGLRIFSYLVSGRVKNGLVISELLYSSSSLLVLVNDAILRKSANINIRVPVPHAKLSLWLTVLEYVEVFLELAATTIGGDLGRWTMVTIVHMIKAAIKLLLLLRYKSGIQLSPAFPPLKRDKELPSMKRTESVLDATAEKMMPSHPNFTTEKDLSPTFTLGRSGRVVRKLAAAPPLSNRTWKLPAETSVRKRGPGGVFVQTSLNKKETLGETLHIVRPLAHLASLLLCGRHSWKPWLLSCGVDASSSYLLGDRSEFNVMEQAELKRRRILMVLYLLRSPLYDRHSRVRLLGVLEMIANNVPLSGLIIRPLMDYLPVWQRIYFYVWMT